jgi:hypothetical protein
VLRLLGLLGSVPAGAGRRSTKSALRRSSSAAVDRAGCAETTDRASTPCDIALGRGRSDGLPASGVRRAAEPTCCAALSTERRLVGARVTDPSGGGAGAAALST